MITFEIGAGPSKFELMTALFDRKGNAGKPHYVVFKSPDGESEITTRINSVGIEDGSGESWLITGQVIKMKCGTFESRQGFAFHGWYSTKGRGGRIEEIPRK